MLNMGLQGLFKVKQETPAPSISAVVLRKEDQERMLPLLKEAGFAIDNLDTETEGLVIVKQEEYDAENVITIALKNDTAVILSHIEKSFTPYPDTLDFDEKLKAAGFFPSVAMATDALMDTVYGIMNDARSPDEVKSKMDVAMQSYTQFVSALTSALPVAAFKAEQLDNKVKAEETPVPAKDTTEATADADATGADDEKTTVSKEKTEAVVETTAKDEAGAGEGSAAEATVDKDVAKEGGKDEEDKITQLIGLIASLKQDLTSGLTAVKDDLTKVKADTEGFASRIEQVEAVAKSAETAVKGTVIDGATELVPDESLGNQSRSRRTQKGDADAIWAGSPIDHMLRL